MQATLKSGQIAYYWYPKYLGKKAGMTSEALGTDYDVAMERARKLNAQMEEILREQKEEAHLSPNRPVTVDRLITMYERDFDMFRSLQPKTQRGYTSNLKIVSRELGDIRIDAFTPQLCHRWYVSLREKYSLKRANVIFIMTKMLFRLAVREDMIDLNPFAAVKVKSPRKRTRELLSRTIWTREHYNTFIATCMKKDEVMMAAAAMMAFELCQRQGDIIGTPQIDDEGERYWHAALWADYDGQKLRIVQSKTDVPVYVDIASHVPELKQLLDSLPRRNPQIINYVPKRKKGQRGNLTIRPYKEDHFRRVYRSIRDAAGLPEDLKFMNLRHGGLTELGSLEAGDDVKMALSGHKQRQTLDKYVFPTSDMADRALQIRNKNKSVQTALQMDRRSDDENIEENTIESKW